MSGNAPKDFESTTWICNEKEIRITVLNPFADVHRSFVQTLKGSNDPQSLCQKMYGWSGFVRHEV